MMAEEFSGNMVSPGGFMFGVQGWTWGEPKPKSITFFLDGSAMVCDQHGRPIRGVLIDNKEVRFAMTPPEGSGQELPRPRPGLANHQQVVAALMADLQVDWTKLASSGWPQLSYVELKKLTTLPPTPATELSRIHDRQLRNDALRMRREHDNLERQQMDEQLAESTAIDDEPAGS